MNRNLLRRRNSATDLVLLTSLYTLESSALLLAMAICKKGDEPTLSFLASRPGLYCLFALLILLASCSVILHQYRKSQRNETGWFGLTVMMNLITVFFLLAIGELVVRTFSFKTPEGEVFMNTLLLPRSWGDEVVRNRKILNTRTISSSYHVYDDLLGWAVGPNRRSEDGLYSSSVEGLRSPRSNMAFANRPARYRIALVGDSNTFGMDVKYEESWGYQLERGLGPEFQVLNFGVMGYGVDQAYLRYYRDVRRWHPDFVIFGLIGHNLVRTMVVYPFISFPNWESPFAKPRFVDREGQITNLNVPPMSPDAIFSKNSIKDLPLLDYDSGYNQSDWEWHYYHLSYLFRFLISKHPCRPVPGPNVSDEAMKLVNRELLRSFVRLATAEGSTPIVVYFPQRGDFQQSSKYPGGRMGTALQLLQDAGVVHEDLTPCLEEISASERFVVGTAHYSPQANGAVAACLREVILKHGQRTN